MKICLKYYCEELKRLAAMHEKLNFIQRFNEISVLRNMNFFHGKIFLFEYFRDTNNLIQIAIVLITLRNYIFIY